MQHVGYMNLVNLFIYCCRLSMCKMRMGILTGVATVTKGGTTKKTLNLHNLYFSGL